MPATTYRIRGPAIEGETTDAGIAERYAAAGCRVTAVMEGDR